MLKNKKGSLQDLVLIVSVLLSLSFIILLGFKITTEVNTNLQAQPDELVTANAKTASTSLTGYYPGVIDNSFLFFYVMINLTVIVLAALVRIHPIFIPFFFIGLVFIVFITGIASNIYQTAASSDILSIEADQLTFTSLIMEYLPFFTGIFGFILMAVSYKLWRLDVG